MAVAALVLGVLWPIAFVVLVWTLARAWSATRPLPADVTSARDAHTSQLVVGNCLGEVPSGGQVDVVRVVPCSRPHAATVVLRTRLTGDSWPGQAAADEQVAALCRTAEPEQAAAGLLFTWAPTPDGWDSGDRLGLCLARTD